MITCEILGHGADNNGLGNQMFCIATALGLAYDNDDTATFPELMYPPYDFYGRTIFHKLTKLPINVTEVYHEPAYSSTIYKQIPYKQNMSMRGHFQSYKYFESSQDKIIELFELPRHMSSSIEKKYKHILDNAFDKVSIHIRRGDYLKLQGHYASLDLEYYQNALDMINKDQIVLFSDDIAWCKENIYFKNKQVEFIEGEMDIVDMHLMSKIPSNIIANSTFSWWAAFLNKNKDKKIIGPSQWFGPKRSKCNETETKDLFPPDWIRI
tara:strand:- start:1007 stop:1807 length:801 start_codon:yes stop_codon:yes gene_type:complete